MILQIIISNKILDLVTGILAKISLGTGIGTPLHDPPTSKFDLRFRATEALEYYNLLGQITLSVV